MFAELRDNILLMFSRRWPTADARVTRVYFDPQGSGIRIAYEFSIRDDGPYIGEFPCPPWFGGIDLIDVTNRFKVGTIVPVKYKQIDPSVNKIDPASWRDLEDDL